MNPTGDRPRELTGAAPWRVAVLARVAPWSWTAHYIHAFRAVCDVRVIGPEPDPATLRRLARAEVAVDAPAVDITCNFDDPPPLESLWPADWQPDLVVGIAPLGGAALHPGVHTLDCPTAFLSIDTWQCLGDYEEARRYDAVFCAQREFVAAFHAAGARHAFWLPLACDPQVHRLPDIAPDHDVAFAGSTSQPIHAARRALLDALQPQCTVLHDENLFGDAAGALQARGRLAFNHCAVQEVNMRVFEALAMGRPLLCNDDAVQNGLTDLFEDGQHLRLYHDAPSLCTAARQLLDDPAEAARIAAAGQAEVWARHTYVHRVEALLTAIAGLVRGDDAYWHRAPGLPKPLLADGVPPVPVANRPPGTRNSGAQVAAYLPNLPGVVVDLGLGLGASKHALRHLGAHALHGLAWDAAGAASRQGSYETLWIWPDPPPVASADTIILADRPASPLGMLDALRRAHTTLRPGGTLLWRVLPADLEAAAVKPAPGALGQWLAAQDFILRAVGPALPDGSCVVQARKRTRRTRDIVCDILTRIQPPGLDVAALVARIPEIY